MKEKLQRLWATKNKNDEWWSSFVTSPAAILVNFYVVDWKWLTPNLLTLVSFLVACVSVVLIVVGQQTAFYFAAALIQFSHILDCMDGQMARYRKTTSRSGGFWDKMTDQVQVTLWFGAIGFAAHAQSSSVLPIYLAFAGVAFYSLRGYIKYTTIFIEMCDDKDYLEKSIEEVSQIEDKINDSAGLGHSFSENIVWFVRQQRKFLNFDEGVFIFMLSIGLIFNALMPMLWFFAVSQVFYGVARSFQRGSQLHHGLHSQILTTTEK